MSTVWYNYQKKENKLPGTESVCYKYLKGFLLEDFPAGFH